MWFFENRLFLRQNTFFLCVLAKLKFYLSPKLNFLSRFGELCCLSFAKTQFFITFWRIVLFIFRQNSIFYHVLANCLYAQIIKKRE